MTTYEIEIKFYLGDMDDTREKIKKLGAVFEKKEKENNIRFEDKNFSLIKNGALLRLRKTNNYNALTYKGRVTTQSECKVYDETEVAVSDFEKTVNLLANIGYRPVQRYEKIRETFTVGGAIICLDTMPYGNFIEIEGEPSIIRNTAEKLDLKWENRILSNYLAIFEQLKQEFDLDFTDVTFENFKNKDIDFGGCAHKFAAS